MLVGECIEQNHCGGASLVQGTNEYLIQITADYKSRQAACVI